MWKIGPGCDEVAGGGVSAGMGCVRVFNTGDDGGEKLLEATVRSRSGRTAAARGMDDWTEKEKPYRCFLS